MDSNDYRYDFIFFMPAALSDFSLVPVKGKIPSDQEALTLTLKRNPKLISRLRDHVGIKSFIVRLFVAPRATKSWTMEAFPRISGRASRIGRNPS